MKLEFIAVGRKLADRRRHEETARMADLARVASALQPEAILLDVDARGAERALRIAADAISMKHALNPTLVFDALWRREQAASTALGNGFAIPHARLAGIERPATLFIRLRNAIPFGAADDAPVSHLLVVLVPKDGADADHLLMLSFISQLFARRGFKAKLERASDVAEADAVFRDAVAPLVRRAARDGS